MKRAWLLAAAHVCALSCALSSCKPDVGERDSLVLHERVLAIKGEPAEAKPGEAVTLTALVAAPNGTVENALVAWAACAAPKPLGENDVVTTACLGDGDAVRVLGTASTALDTKLPDDACSIYGPDVASAEQRPRSPDVTGGFYQPVRATVAARAGEHVDVAIALQRVACKLASAPADVATDFGKRYVNNVNPRIATVTGVPDRIAPGARITLEVRWSDADAETYVVFDPSSQALVTRRESLRVSWFATAGAFDADKTGRAGDDPATFSTNGWLAPSSPGVVHAWVVVRDSRGGIDFVTRDLVVGAP